jgi:hypothetical protein
MLDSRSDSGELPLLERGDEIRESETLCATTGKREWREGFVKTYVI